MAKAFIWANVSPDFLTSRSYNSSGQPVLVESGKCCIFVRYRTKVAVTRSASLAAFDVKSGNGCAAVHTLIFWRFTVWQLFSFRRVSQINQRRAPYPSRATVSCEKKKCWPGRSLW